MTPILKQGSKRSAQVVTKFEGHSPSSGSFSSYTNLTAFWDSLTTTNFVKYCPMVRFVTIDNGQSPLPNKTNHKHYTFIFPAIQYQRQLNRYVSSQIDILQLFKCTCSMSIIFMRYVLFSI